MRDAAEAQARAAGETAVTAARVRASGEALRHGAPA
jgi:hypothetical protein